MNWKDFNLYCFNYRFSLYFASFCDYLTDILSLIQGRSTGTIYMATGMEHYQ